MRYSIVAVLAIGAALLQPAAAEAQRRKVHITDVRVGYKSGFERDEVVDARWQYLFKAGQWTPVWVDIEAGDAGFQGGELVVETTDSDDVQNNYTVLVPALPPRGSEGSAPTVLTFTKPGTTGSEIVVTVRNDRESDTHKKMYEAVPLDDLLFLTAGSHFTGLKQSLGKEVGQVEGGNAPNVNLGIAITHGRVAYVDSVPTLPTRWFAYQPIDLVIISTSKKEFVDDLIGREAKVRQDALSEWVRRGGRLVVTAGKNHDLAKAILEALHMKALPVEFEAGGMQVPQLGPVERWVPGQHKQKLANVLTKPGDKAPPPIDAAKLKLKPGQAEVLISGPDKNETHPLMVRMPFGMGQVTLVAFDLDQPPFTRWDGQLDFWKRFRAELGAALSTSQDNAIRGGYNRIDDNDLAGLLRNQLENFPDVSNVSFGWVALFIFIYILVVGPLDYFFLKKVVKRLELTWITFPAVVLIVSTVSYFTAYALKGNDLLINKADLVDIDLNSRTIYGHTWFTLFSPRIQHYTIGIEPAAPVWAVEPPDDKKAESVVVSWMGRPDASFGGYGRARSQSLFRRAYNYAPDAGGLEGVPIQVWSMKSFTASWDRPYDPDKPPISAVLLPKEGAQPPFQGTITNQLPVAIDNVYLIYGRSGQANVYAFDQPLKPGEPQRINFNKPGVPLTAWPASLPANAAVARNAPVAGDNKEDIFRRLTFHGQLATLGQAKNISLRELDEGWRVRLSNEVILFGRIAQQSASAETVTNDPASPSRLWLGQVPAPKAKRPELLGTLTQDTYVRVFLPIKGDANPQP